jgi:hypothetical protein
MSVTNLIPWSGLLWTGKNPRRIRVLVVPKAISVNPSAGLARLASVLVARQSHLVPRTNHVL